MTVYRDTLDNGNLVTEEVFHIMECTYSGQDMGERKVVANIKWATPIDFKTGDYIELQMQTLNTGVGLEGAIGRERFYIYTQPTIKKNARAMSSGEAFEHTVTFYPRQYELGCVQMRDYIQQNANADTIIYTGFDTVSFVGGAHELMERVMACLAESFHDEQGHPLWSYELSPSVNEDLNLSLERFPFSFSGNSVMDALLKLNDKEGINTTFFINGRTIYVGYRRPYFCRVTDSGGIDTDVNSQIFNFEYGKTSHEPIGIDHGGLFNITKAVGNESPITKLYAYGASRNLNRYYCADRIRSGRYVNRLMLPSFDDDGRTDYIISEEGVAKYGIREASKQFEDIYPSLRYMTYGDLRQVKYCIKVKASGLAKDAEDLSGHSIADSTYPIVRIQCYKVVESAVQGVNKLIECAPPEDLAVMIHATGKVVKTILYGGATNQEALAKQLSHDAKVPTRDGGTDYIPGSCFAVHDYGYGGDSSHGRAEWFTSPQVWAEYGPEEQERINAHQITYADTFWLTDLYVFTEYEQTVFNRDGYSAWAYPRINAKYQGATDSTLVNEIVAVEPIVIEDTSWNVSERTNQQYFDIYMRDVGFKIDEQNDFGEMVFIVDGTLKVSVLDGLLTGREFEVSGKVTDSQFSCVCAYNEDGTENDEFWTLPDSQRTSTGSQYARAARDAGAIWRIRLLRLNNNDQNYANLDIILPMKGLEMHAGDHVVFLDIFMPDVYIHAAENRLERAARKYLDANDKGTVNYSVEFDKVRVGQQIPNYALQMREGLNIRMRDADLDIVTQSGAKVLADYMPKGLTSTVQMYSQEEAYEEHEGTLYNPENGGSGLMFFAYAEDGNRYLKFTHDVISPIQLSGDDIVVSAFDIGIMTDKGAMRHYDVVASAVAMFTPKSSDAGTYKYELVFRFDELSTLKRMLKDAAYERVGDKDCVRVSMKATTHVYTGQEQESAYVVGKEYYCKSNEVFDFMRNKYYDVVIDIPETACLDYVEDLPEPKVPELVLSAVPASDGYNYKPQILHAESALGIGEGQQAFRRYTYTFYLDDSFNEDYSYKPAIKFIQDGETESCSIRLQKIVEKDIDVPTPSVNYIDLKVDSVTIKITDNTRPDDRRIQKVYPQPIYDIQATFKEASQASAWMQLSQQVAENAIEAAASTHVSENVVNMARRYYRELLSLRSNIFDPDGNCDQVFLNVMMMQIGADSMNFRLEKTAVKQGVENDMPTIIPSNYTLEKNIVTGNWTFGILSDDTLYHYVFTQGSQGGTWSIENKINGTQQSSVILASQQSEGVTIYPVYYVCLKCPVDGTTGSWLVTTKQYASNDAEDANYWYFNWGILQPDSAGNYSLIETRGNAYMYGDNLVCGRIRSQSGGSFFDLNNGEMVLGGDSGGANGALEYKNGRLTIRGISDQVRDIVDGILLTGENFLSKRLMLDWNKTYDGITSFGFADGRSYFAINEWLLYRYIGDQSNYADILGSKVVFETGARYCLKVEWCLDAEHDNNGLYLGFKYTDGTYGAWIMCESDTTSPTVDTLVSAEGKTVAGIRCTYGDVNNTRIYNISLTKGENVPDVWIEAVDDVEPCGENLYQREDPIAVGTSEYIELGVTLKKDTRYLVSAEEILYPSTSVATPYITLYEGVQSGGTTTMKALGRLRYNAPIDLRECIVVGSGGVLYAKIDTIISLSASLSGVMVQPGTRKTAYQNAYRYLAESFENAARAGQTDIEGGLLATTLLKLRNMNGVVTAGMSGLDDQGKKIENGVLVDDPKSHGVGMWAGATYLQALEAAAGLRRIPVLFTKDGIGSMVGVFSVKEDKIEVNGTNGTIVIDDDEGMTIYDASNYLKTIITPRSISDAQSGVQGMIDNSVIKFPSTSSYGYKYQDITLNNTSRSEKHQIQASVIKSDGRKRISLDVGVRFRGSGQRELSRFETMIFRVTLENQSTGEVVYAVSKTGTATIMRDGYDEFFSQFYKFSIDQDLAKGTYAMFVEIGFNVPDGEYIENAEYYQGLIDDYQCRLEIDSKEVNETLDGDYTWQVVVGETMRNTFGVKVSAYTILGNDGILSYYNANTYFKVINGSGGQKIFAKGLGTTGESGQLIKKTGAYKNFAVQLKEFLKEYFTDISKKSGFSNALESLVDSLPDDTFITAV